jgi:hypothetical protein
MFRKILGADRFAAGAEHARDTHWVQSLCQEKSLRHWNDETHDATPPIWFQEFTSQNKDFVVKNLFIPIVNLPLFEQL